VGNIRWKLKECLELHDITPYALGKETPGLSLKLVYRLTNNQTEGVKFSTLAALMDGISRLCGKPVTFDDLLEYRREE
jgi:hypothetical protein